MKTKITPEMAQKATFHEFVEYYVAEHGNPLPHLEAIKIFIGWFYERKKCQKKQKQKKKP